MLINKKLLKLTEGIRGNILVCSLFYSLLYAVRAAISYLTARIVSMITGPNVPLYLIGIIILIAISVLLSLISKRLDAKVRNKFLNDMSVKLSQKLLELGMSYMDTTRTGYVTSMFVSRTQALVPYYSMYIPILLSTIFITTSVSIYLMSINIGIGLISLFCLSMVIIIPYFWYKPMYKRGIKNWTAMSNFSSDFLDNLQGIETLKLLPGNEPRKEAFKDRSQEISRLEMEGLYVSSIENALLILFATLGTVATTIYAAILTYKEILTINELLIVLFLSAGAFSPVYLLMNAWHLGFRGVTAVDHIYDFLAQTKKPMSKDIAAKKEGLSLENIYFSYESGKEILKDISLYSPKGSITALVGPSGSGKTTIAAIIAGLYTPDKGALQYSGLNLNEENLAKWHSQTAAVWQRPYLFDGTLYENIAIAKSDASYNEVLDACEKAMLKDLISQLPQGLDTQVGEHGARLSGGEAQRVAIARCFLKSADIIIFDEATSSLDEHNQRKIKEAVNELVKDKTVILIAHRLSTVIQADRIHFIKDGKILHSGTHKELLENSPEYKSLLYSGGDLYA